jgi:anthranilate synthase component 1
MPTKTVVFDDLTPAAAYAALRARDAGKPSFLLESAPNAGERWGRYSILGWRPRRKISVDLLEGARAVRLISEPLRGSGERVEVHGASRDVLSLLRAHVLSSPSRPVAAGTPRVVDGAVGYVAYDLVHALEPVGPWTEDRRVACFLDGATTVVFDARLQTVTIHGDDESDVAETIAALSERTRLRPMPLPSRGAAPAQVSPSVDDATYEENVRRAKKYIEAGDVFQVVLARTFTSPRGNADPFDAYRAMRVLNASPYLYFLELGDMSIAGASPETLVRLEDGQVTLRPLAGTRPRGDTDERDLELERELLADPKERAEHVMLVDLGRNDVGRVAKIGSVRVPVQMSIERYSHVMHLVSEVHGELAEGKDAWDVLAAAFPAGTLSGAPKVRAMQIIRELEGRPRGIYGGAIGYVSRHGTMDLAIAIRTLVAYADRFEVGAGAGVVEASDPALEAAETRHKASAALAAIAAAQQMAGSSETYT